MKRLVLVLALLGIEELSAQNIMHCITTKYNKYGSVGYSTGRGYRKMPRRHYRRYSYTSPDKTIIGPRDICIKD